MRIVIIAGSMRDGSRTLEVCNYLKELLSRQADVSIINLAKTSLPFYDDSDAVKNNSVWTGLEKELAAADGFVFASPEWNGMFSAGIHNLLNYTSSGSTIKPLAHKPVMLVSVSSGMGGVYPLAQMRMTGGKNNNFVLLPDSLRFAKVKEVLVGGEIVQEGLKARTHYAVDLLIEYAEAFAKVRSSGKVDMVNFANGV